MKKHRGGVPSFLQSPTHLDLQSGVSTHGEWFDDVVIQS